jgi:hypothetical protein
MRWFQLIPFDESIANPFLTDSEFLGEFEPWELAEGREIRNWKTELWLRCTTPECDGELSDVLQNHLALPIYSERLQSKLKEAGITGIQFLPVRVIRYNGAPVEGYAVANVLNIRDALDLEHSDCDRHGEDYFQKDKRGQISGIKRPVLRSKELGGVDVVRLTSFTVSLFASSLFREVFFSNGFRGHQFREVEVT